jgi:single-strand DNA-binding protein
MASFNKAVLMGNLTRDPELRATPSGAPVCNFDLATNRSYTTQGGEKRDEVCYLTVVVWGKQGENCAEYLKKGRQALVEGHLQQRSWTTPDGQKRSKLEVVAERVQFLGDGRGPRTATAPDPDADPPAHGPETDPPAPSDADVPFLGNAATRPA